MLRNRFARLLVFLSIFCFAAVSECRAENTVIMTGTNTRYPDPGNPTGCEFIHRTKKSDPIKLPPAPIPSVHIASPQEPMPVDNALPPMLPGATNGTIGPPSSSVPLTLSGTETIHDHKSSSVIPMLLFAAFSVSLIILGIRSIISKKRAPLWSFGLIAAGALMPVGFMLSFYQPVTTSSPYYIELKSQEVPPAPIGPALVSGAGFYTTWCDTTITRSETVRKRPTDHRKYYCRLGAHSTAAASIAAPDDSK